MQTSPPVSVVIPVRNDARYIGICLASLRATTYPKARLEVLVVDGESDDGTREIVQRFQSDGLSLRLLENPKRSRCAALNAGIGAARGEIILRLDARNVVPPDYIGKCVQALRATGAHNVGGFLRPLARSTTQEAIGLAMSHHFGVGNARFRLEKSGGYVDSVYLGCFPREVFGRVGLFDDDASVISEDSDMNQRIRASGAGVYLDPTIEIYYYPRETLRDLGRLYFRYGGARAGTILKHHRPTSLRQLVPATFLLTLGTLGVLTPFHRAFALSFLAMASFYLACNVVVSAWLSCRKRKWALGPRLLAAFPVMHFAFALGFLRRMLQRPRPGTYWGY